MSLSLSDADADGRCWRACEQLDRLEKLCEQPQAGRQRSQQIAAQIQSAYQHAQVQWRQAQATWNRILASRDLELTPTAAKDMLQHSPYARLMARLETMPVIEQAKGVIMAQSSCSQDRAFDTLRRASQRLNMPVRDLAAKIVDAASRCPVSAGPPARPSPPVPGVEVLMIDPQRPARAPDRPRQGGRRDVDHIEVRP